MEEIHVFKDKLYLPLKITHLLLQASFSITSNLLTITLILHQLFALFTHINHKMYHVLFPSD